MDESNTKGILRVAILSIAFLIAAGTITFHTLEDWSWIESFYFTVVTLTTVGYGDLAPTTEASRLFAAAFILLGVGTVAGAIGALGSRRINRRASKKK